MIMNFIRIPNTLKRFLEQENHRSSLIAAWSANSMTPIKQHTV